MRAQLLLEEDDDHDEWKRSTAALGDRIIAVLDLKADRLRQELLVQRWAVPARGYQRVS